MSATSSALAKKMASVPVTAGNTSTEMKAAVKRIFFFIGNLCFVRGFSAVKAFLSRFLESRFLD